MEHKRKRRIFILEDNSQNLFLFTSIVKTIPNCEIFAYDNANDGLNAINEIIPDIILLDIQLGDISGIIICQKLRGNINFKNIPIIAITAFAMKGDKERILESGFTDYISKPIDMQEFRERIQHYLPF